VFVQRANFSAKRMVFPVPSGNELSRVV